MIDLSCSMRVLVVDDNDDAAASMVLLLKHLGHEAHAAGGGSIALGQAALLTPDIMFIDLAMPPTDGLSLARQLRQTPKFAHVPLVAVSALVDAEHRAQASAVGFDDFLPKPYPMRQLLETLGRQQAKALSARGRAKQRRPSAERTRSRTRIEESPPVSADQSSAETQVAVAITKSGLSSTLTLPSRAAANELRRWLKEQRCRIGPVFQRHGDLMQFSFCVYSRRQALGEIVAMNVRFRNAGRSPLIR